MSLMRTIQRHCEDEMSFMNVKKGIYPFSHSEDKSEVNISGR